MLQPVTTNILARDSNNIINSMDNRTINTDKVDIKIEAVKITAEVDAVETLTGKVVSKEVKANNRPNKILLLTLSLRWHSLLIFLK